MGDKGKRRADKELNQLNEQCTTAQKEEGHDLKQKKESTEILHDLKKKRWHNKSKRMCI